MEVPLSPVLVYIGDFLGASSNLTEEQKLYLLLRILFRVVRTILCAFITTLLIESEIEIGMQKSMQNIFATVRDGSK